MYFNDELHPFLIHPCPHDKIFCHVNLDYILGGKEYSKNMLFRSAKDFLKNSIMLANSCSHTHEIALLMLCKCWKKRSSSHVLNGKLCFSWVSTHSCALWMVTFMHPLSTFSHVCKIISYPHDNINKNLLKGLRNHLIMMIELHCRFNKC